MSGAPFTFLPLIHHCFLVYSPVVAEFITANGFDLYSKNDMRFMESVFKMLVAHFNYKPALSIKQFFE
jgi:centrosomal protein CEP44